MSYQSDLKIFQSNKAFCLFRDTYELHASDNISLSFQFIRGKGTDSTLLMRLHGVDSTGEILSTFLNMSQHISLISFNLWVMWAGEMQMKYPQLMADKNTRYFLEALCDFKLIEDIT